MSKSQLYRTPRKQLDSGEWIEATFGLRVLGDQDPYMTVTASVFQHEWNKHGVAGGCMHAVVLEAFPKLRKCVAWHLATDGRPMHYPANPLYFHKIANFQLKATRLEMANAPDNFRTSAHLGSLDTDLTSATLLEKPVHEVEAYLNRRLPKMREVFRAVVAELPALAQQLGAEPCQP